MKGAVPSAASNMGSDTEFILRGRSFIIMMDNRGPGELYLMSIM
jgi:hypothetical protein